MSEATQTCTLSQPVREEIDGWLAKFPPDHKRSAVLGALRAAQHENHGYLSVAQMDAVAEYLGLRPIEVYEIGSFYSMLETRPVGRNCVAVCTNISCMLNGADELVTHIEKKLGIELGQSTADGRIYLKREEECLAACSFAPVMQVNHVYHERLDRARIDSVLDSLE